MKTKGRVTRVWQCLECPDRYITTAGVDIRLAEGTRKRFATPTINPETDTPYTGVCPKHTRKLGADA